MCAQAPKRKRSKTVASEPARARGPVPPIVAVGGSAGGLEAFLEMLLALPADCPFALVLVLHGDAHRPSVLGEVVARNTALPVVKAEDGTLLEPSHIYVIPAGFDARVAEGRIALEAVDPEAHPRPSIDRFFESLAGAPAAGVIAVVLSGTGNDGASGLRAVREAGGATLVQDPTTARFPAMPHNAIGEADVDFILAPHLIAREISLLTRHPYLVGIHQARFGRTLPQDADEVARILNLLKAHKGVDFASYKQTTVLRRIRRRMALHDLAELAEYAKLLTESRSEVDALYADMLINVTRFFREPESFEALRNVVFPAIFDAHRARESIRIWIPGCSTGEQVYSIAITLIEAMRERDVNFAGQLFGTDISDEALARARLGRYPRTVLEPVSAEHLERYFVHDEDGFRVCKQVREMCVFARQNVLYDPPFSRIDLIVCTNLLIYLDGAAQRRLIPFFHYALRPSGFLVLGSSESIGAPAGLFSLTDKRQKIYVKRSAQSPLHLDFSRSGPVAVERPPAEGERKMSGGSDEPDLDPGREADRLLLARYAPAGVVVNAEMDVVQFRGRTGAFLEPASGPASHNLYKMAREGLLADLRAATLRAKDTGVVCRREGVRVRVNDHYAMVAIEVTPLRSRGNETFYLVTFEQAAEATPAPPASRRRKARQNDEMDALRRALDETQADLQSIIEEKEAANEELKAANEEIQSSNEELQSTNEELQTVKEEIQSANEELSTINDELQTRNFELSEVNNDLNNLLNNVTIPLVMLGQDLRIRRFTPMAEKLFNMIPGDIGRPITDINLNLQVENLSQIVHEVLEDLTAREMRVSDRGGHWYAMRVRPYRTAERKVDGVVLSLFEIDDLRQSLRREQHVSKLLEAVARASGMPLVVFADGGQVLVMSGPMCALLGVDPPGVDLRGADLPVIGEALDRYLAEAGGAPMTMSTSLGRLRVEPLAEVAGAHLAVIEGA